MTFKTYNEVPVDLTDSGSFTVKYMDTDKSFNTYSEATRYIDECKSRDAANAREKLSIPIITDDGVERTITGIHATRKTILVAPKTEASYYKVYPKHNNVAVLLRAEKLARQFCLNVMGGILANVALSLTGNSIESLKAWADTAPKKANGLNIAVIDDLIKALQEIK
jgi:hypothetical protein